MKRIPDLNSNFSFQFPLKNPVSNYLLLTKQFFGKLRDANRIFTKPTLECLTTVFAAVAT